MVLDRDTGAVAHRRFAEFAGELTPGDLLVLNDTKVIPARLYGTKPTGGRVEILLSERIRDEPGASRWRALISDSRSIRPGSSIAIDGGVSLSPVQREGEVWEVVLSHPARSAGEAVEAVGRIPLPPYIHRDADDPRAPLDRTRYQTIFARHAGAVAAPTAGLHLTEATFDALRTRGIATAFLTLHVGLGTFLPIRVADVDEHRMHEEAFVVPEATAEAVRAARTRGRRVVAVGTTVTRALESRGTDSGEVTPGAGRTALFIRPGFRFRVVDALLTNFHLPQSTLLMLVCAFAGKERTLAAYAGAVRSSYRFFSYGDAMLVRGA